MTDMPTTYDQPPPPAQKEGCGCHTEYIRKLPAILEIVELVLTLVTLIIVSTRSGFIKHDGGGYVQFVCSVALIWTGLLFFFHFTGCIHKLPGPWPLIKFASYVALSILFLIAASVCSAYAKHDDAIAAATFFCWLVLVIYVVDTFFKYRDWRASRHTRSDPPPNVDHATPQY